MQYGHQQYKRFVIAKTKNPGCVILQRTGNFYELFEEDVKTLPLGNRSNEIMVDDKAVIMGDFHFSKLREYLRLLASTGHAVVIF